MENRIDLNNTIIRLTAERDAAVKAREAFEQYQPGFTEAIQQMETRTQEAEVDAERLREALQAIETALREDEKSHYRAARAFLDARNIYHDDLAEERVLLAVVQAALSD